MQSALLDEWMSDFVEEAEQKTDKKVREEIATTLLREGQSPDYVAKIVKFPIDKVKKLADSVAK